MIADPYRMVFMGLISSFILGISLLFYRYVYPKKSISLLALLILISILPVISIFRSGTYQAGDLTLHSVVLQSFYENLSQGNIVPQWAGEICGGYGCPAHMFEYPLPYYVASIFHFIGFGYINSVKIFLAVSFILSGIAMFLWLKSELGKLPAFVGSLFYLFAPYHLEDLHFRVSAGEVLSYVPLPFIFLFLRILLTTKKKIYLLMTGFFTGLLVLAHGNSLMSAMPVIIIYILFLLKDSKEKVKDFFYALSSILFGFLFTAFYWLPTLFEIKYTWYPIAFFISDFKPFLEYIYSPARYGFLFQGSNGELRLIIGYFHILAVFLAFFLIYKKRVFSKYRVFLYSLLVIFFIYFFMLLGVSKPLWDILPLFKTFIFPWRLLIPMAFIMSIITAILTRSIKNKLFIYVICFLVVMTTILNWGNRMMVPEDKNAYHSHIWGYTEYFEQNNPYYISRQKSRVSNESVIVSRRIPASLKFLTGKGIVKILEKNQTYHKYLVEVKKDSVLSEYTNYFPGWHIYVNNQIYKFSYEDKRSFGTLVFSLPKGSYLVEVEFKDTPIRKLGKEISAISLLFFLLILLIKAFYFLPQRVKYLFTKFSQV